LQITGEASGGNGVKIRDGLAAEARAPYLAGHTISDLVRAQQRATADALVAAKRPVRTIALERLDEYALGALMMHFMIETILAAALLKVDPFDQPAVELGKRLTRQYLSA
jgi:glucose-6-phosphate isomerase